MIRPLLINPLFILGAAIMGAVGCRLNGANFHAHELIAAAGIGLVASEVAVALAVTQRGADTVQMAQAALMALAAQLLLSLALSAVMMLCHFVGPAFVWWMLVMFWVTLLGVCTVLVRAVRAAAASSATSNGLGR